LDQFVNTFGPFLCRTSGNPVLIVVVLVMLLVCARGLQTYLSEGHISYYSTARGPVSSEISDLLLFLSYFTSQNKK